MKTIEQEIRERLAAESLSPAQVDSAMTWIKADTLCRALNGQWDRATEGYSDMLMEAVWMSARSSMQDWLVAQITAPMTKENEIK